MTLPALSAIGALVWTTAVVLHVGGGALGILSGYAALAVRKGDRLHRVAGTIFFAAMLTMAGLAAVLAFLGSQRLNTIAAVFTLYLVATAWAVVQRRPGTTGRFEVIALAGPLAVIAAGVVFGLLAASPQGLEDGDPSSGNGAQGYFAFAGVAALAAVLDLKVLLNGGVAGQARISRHLWRMCAALFVASGSFFLGQMDEIPQVLHGPHLYVLALAPLVALAFWLVRVRIGRAFKPTPATA